MLEAAVMTERHWREFETEELSVLDAFLNSSSGAKTLGILYFALF